MNSRPKPFPAIVRIAPLLLAVGCAAPAPRFDGGPVITRVLDVHDVESPAEFEWWRHPQLIRNFGRDQMRLELDPAPARPARDVNRLGEVPSSSWYENRPDGLAPDDVARGPAGEDPGPESHRPWSIVGLKAGGRNPGFLFEDSRGVRYIAKFDKVGAPETASGSGAVANRLFWALGYHVPEDRVVFFEREDLVIEEGATVRDEAGRRAPLTDAIIDEILDAVPARTPDGDFRILCSRFLPGRPIGGYAYAGTRSDDPNDRIPHEDRRSLRALQVFGAWLNHVDLKRDNTLDMWVEAGGRHYLQHYLVDFDGCLGGYWAARHESRIGWAYDFDLGELIAGIPLLGLAPRPYDDYGPPENRTVGLYEATEYDPATWTANYLNDHVLACRPADVFWAGTVLARVSDEAVRAAATTARFRDPDATAVLARALVDRRWKTLEWALSRVSPVVGLGDAVEEPGGSLRFPAEDALSGAGLPAMASYRVEVLGVDGEPVTGAMAEVSAGTPEVRLAAADVKSLDYLVIRWTATDARGNSLPPTDAHYRKRAAGGWRLVGILRDGE